MYRTTFDERNKQWNGAKIKSDFNPEESLGRAILNSLQMYGSKVAQVRETHRERSLHL